MRIARLGALSRAAARRSTYLTLPASVGLGGAERNLGDFPDSPHRKPR